MRKNYALSMTVAAMALLFSLGLSGCGTSETELEGEAVIQLTDVPFESLTSFEITITRIELISGGESEEVFPPTFNPGAKLTVDLVELRGERRLIAVDRVPEGEYNAARVTFEGAAADGGAVAVTPAAGTVQVDFSSPAVVRRDQTTVILLDLDGVASVTTTGPSSLTFSPVFFDVRGDERLLVRETEGVVSGIGLRSFTLAVDDADRAGGEPVFELGRLEVLVNGNTLFRINGSLLTGTTGLPLLVVGDVVEVTGRLGPEGILADHVQVDRALSPSGLRVRGTITSLTDVPATPGFEFESRFDRLERDQSAEFSTLTVGDTFSAATGSETSFSRRVGAGPAGTSNLFVGQAVELEGAFPASSFSTVVLEIRRTVLTGTLSSVDFAANTAVLTVTEVNGAPVAEFPGIGDVTVDHSGSTVTLEGIVPVDRLGLASGQEVEVEGFFTAADAFEADLIRVTLAEPSQFSGTLVSSDPFTGTFLATVAGAPARIILSESTRAFFRRGSAPGTVFVRTRGDFLRELEQAIGLIQVRGRRFGSDIQATRVDFTTS